MDRSLQVARNGDRIAVCGLTVQEENSLSKILIWGLLDFRYSAVGL